MKQITQKELLESEGLTSYKIFTTTLYSTSYYYCYYYCYCLSITAACFPCCLFQTAFHHFHHFHHFQLKVASNLCFCWICTTDNSEGETEDLTEFFSQWITLTFDPNRYFREWVSAFEQGSIRPTEYFQLTAGWLLQIFGSTLKLFSFSMIPQK